MEQRKPPLIAINQLKKDYLRGGSVFASVDLSVGEGDFVTLLGPSGCGKSTLLRLIAGLSPVSGGSIRVGGREPKSARDITSFIFQDASLLPWRTVEGNIALALEFDGVSRKAQGAKIDAVLDLVGLRDVAHYFPRQLSGGMKMRVSIARALVTTPSLLLMDEPFGALDEITRNRLNEELMALKEQKKWTAVFVTHSVPESVFLSNRIAIMCTRPTSIVREIEIPFLFPRTAELRRTSEFMRAVGEVSAALSEAS
jgi:NitT/TauT family transport system ATP-binding protein